MADEFGKYIPPEATQIDTSVNDPDVSGESEIPPDIALKIEKGYFNPYDGLLEIDPSCHHQIALKLIETGQITKVAGNFDKFFALGAIVALKLIDAGYYDYVSRSLNRFTGLDKEIALKLIEKGCSNYVSLGLNRFTGLDKEIALKLIEEHYESDVSLGLNRFTGLDEEIALKLIEKGCRKNVASHLDLFSGLSTSVALRLIEKGEMYLVARNLDSFTGLDHMEIAVKLIKAGAGESGVIDNLDKFTGLDKKDAAIMLIKAGHDKAVEKNIGKFGVDVSGQSAYPFLTLSEWLVVESYKDVHDLTNSQKIFQVLSEEHPEWQDNGNISGPFERGAEIFGYQRMFDYISRCRSKHDALHGFNNIISNLYEPSGYPAKQFYGNILQQVMADTAGYPEGSSYHRLNTIAQNTSSEQISTTLSEIANFSSIPRLQELSEHIHGAEDVFASWSNLKKFYEIQILLGRREILEKLANLKSEGKDDLYHYVETLAFHETSDVSIEKVMELWQDPERFLAIDDQHSDRQHQMKKPSNYVDIPNLDLTATELRDALVEGALDGLQSFRPLEITYDVVREVDQTDSTPLNELLKKALGSRRDNIPGQANNPGKLFSEVSRYLKTAGVNLQEYLGGTVELAPEQSTNLRSIINDTEFGLQQLGPQATDQFRAKIYVKSDPEGVVAGNDTACCMPFGSGKNNVYTFNPVCSIFTVQKRSTDGKWRTVAQSVLTEDRDIQRNVNQLMQSIQDAETPQIQGLISDDILRDSKSIITADNVEVAPNFRERSGSGQILEEIYRDFFTEYLKRYNESDRFDQGKVIIGEGYSDAMQQLPKVNNTFLPQAPVAYSDNVHPTSYSLSLTANNTETALILARNIVEQEQPLNITEESDIVEITGINGLGYLNYRDTLPVAFLEGKAYADNPELLTYMHNLENGLIAKDINNSAKRRPNMSLKWADNQGKIHGYILAYEGKRKTGEDDYEYEDNDEYEHNNVNSKSSVSHNDGDRVIYISDLASDRESRLAGGNLIKGFIELYRKNYIKKGDPVPIYFEGREQTSYAIVVRQIERISRDLGVEMVIEEGEIYREGDDTMHPVTIRVKQNN